VPHGQNESSPVRLKARINANAVDNSKKCGALGKDAASPHRAAVKIDDSIVIRMQTYVVASR